MKRLLHLIALALCCIHGFASAEPPPPCCLTVTNNLDCTVIVCWTNPLPQCVQVPPHVSQLVNVPCGAAPFKIQTVCGLETIPTCPTQMKRQIAPNCCAWICIGRSPIGCDGWITIDPAAAPCGCP